MAWDAAPEKVGSVLSRAPPLQAGAAAGCASALTPMMRMEIDDAAMRAPLDALGREAAAAAAASRPQQLGFISPWHACRSDGWWSA